ncbi:hypothetical protein [Curvibacter gracilis]|uniref:hypothetical protein n=1 Tax=Curvibacter gracilis TaxID=230310 RepID=UPI0012F8C18C|nr:hypothetical protein [Curvibacter gracilis]
MKLCFVLLGLSLLCGTQNSRGQDHALAVDQCIAERSGADSVICIEKIKQNSQAELRRLERATVLKLKKQSTAGDITVTHYQMAVSALNKASTEFARFSAHQCEFSVGASGAVASGSGQVRGACHVQLNDWRIQYLKMELSKR